ncbi:hypothetical protein [Streptomyces longwoodensis]|uniref:hypothetical protein n=1 Tax=Streptomyces longwoodensis TaxID=68231 RepID=UPI00224E504D|nr:hypothetical protein [Streptomyces longwoodensis]MCX4993831.1 hypothetical protein [Streptomyces longwoodensis]MCX4998049.1 hypothetical protein [Streptomyces longwoodensis]
MGAQPSPDGDELRARHYLHRLGARPLGHAHDAPKRTAMTDHPVTPTRIIPAGAPLPARAPEPGEMPPWRMPPPPAPPAPPAPHWPGPPPPQPAEVVVHHVHEVVLVPVEEPPPRLWERLWDALVTWRMLVAVVAALTPWLGGHSPVGAWAHTVHQARDEASILAAYVIAGLAVAATWAIDRHSSPPGQPGRVLPRFLLVTASLGSLGVLSWWDPILALTGVTR